MRRIVGLDLGQSRDPSALVVLESAPSDEKPLKGTQASENWMVRHIERFPLGRPYPEYVQRVSDLMRTSQLSRATLVIDYTGVGRPVFDMFQAARLNPLGILITGGTSVTHKGRIWHVPKRDLVTAVLALMQSSRMKVSVHLPAAQILVTELLNFRVKVSLAGNDQYEAWRDGDHDDLVLATACASWVGLHVPLVELNPAVGGQHRIQVAQLSDHHLDPRQSYLSEVPTLLRDAPVTRGR